MTGDQQAMISHSPVCEPFFSPFLLSVVFGRAGWIGNSKLLQGTPQITDKETGNRPENAVKKVRLMAVGEIKVCLLFLIFQDYAGREFFPFGNIMISTDCVKPVLLPEFRQELKRFLMGCLNVREGTIFPEFISVSQFDISEILFHIIFQCGYIEKLVFQEIIIGFAGAPVAVAEQHIPGSLVQRKAAWILKSPGNPGTGTHEHFLHFLFCLHFWRLCFLKRRVRRNAAGRKKYR